jgi:sporulation protein YlmC with PRC-barrel domain
MMKNHWLAAAALAGLAVASPGSAQPVAGTTTIGVVAEELQQVYSGWSVKKQILGQPVYNDTGEKVGKVDDLVIAPDKKVSYAIVGAGGFLGIGRHDVVIPVNQFKRENGKLVLPGATKEAIKAMPQFEWAK